MFTLWFRSSFPAGESKPVLLAVVSLDSRTGQWDYSVELGMNKNCITSKPIVIIKLPIQNIMASFMLGDF